VEGGGAAAGCLYPNQPSTDLKTQDVELDASSLAHSTEGLSIGVDKAEALSDFQIAVARVGQTVASAVSHSCVTAQTRKSGGIMPPLMKWLTCCWRFEFPRIAESQIAGHVNEALEKWIMTRGERAVTKR
jgi:hypothetical protein